LMDDEVAFDHLVPATFLARRTALRGTARSGRQGNR
jgi:hypothetical protein